MAAISQSALHARRAVRHRALEMRDAADDVDAHVERALEVLRGVWRAEIAVLREGDELQVDIGRDPSLHLEQRLDGGQPVVADIDMGADGEQALRHREVAIAQRALDHRLDGQAAASARPTARCLRAACRIRSSAAGRATASRPCGNGNRRRAARRGGPARRSRALPRRRCPARWRRFFRPRRRCPFPRVRPAASRSTDEKVKGHGHRICNRRHTVPPPSQMGEGDHAKHGGGGGHKHCARRSPPPPPSAVPLPRFAGEEPGARAATASPPITFPPCGTARAAPPAPARCAIPAPSRRWS